VRRRKTTLPRTNGGSASRTKRAIAPRKPANGRIERSFVDRGPVDRPGQPRSRGKYVYCIISSEKPLRFGQIGIGGEATDVYTIHYRNLGAVVSDAPLEVLDSTRENVLAHERVNETVMHDHTVIPMSFGTIFRTNEDIIELLRSAFEAFGDVLTKMQNKLEFGLKVLWDPDQAIREVEPEGPDVLRPNAVRAPRRFGASGPIRALRVQHPDRAPRRGRRLPHQQAHRG
jgi:hypothetical protein